jgi:ligand-binding SRPBCC domain-containing protein
MPKIFTHTSVIPTTVENLSAFHNQPDVLRRLTMPPLILQVLRDDRSSITSGEIEFLLWFGPIPVRWLARHMPGPIPTSFKDVQIRGPLAGWEHEHRFELVSGGAKLTDQITLEHPPGLAGLLTRLVFDGLLLRLLFIYRHWQTRLALRAKSDYSPVESLSC